MDHNWKSGSIIYQIYPRSFKDSNGDGIGDLQGIIEKLDYLAELGINAIWLSPIYPSPMADFGYDIADFTNIDPIFGTLEDFNELVKQAHTRGIKVIMDFVPNHSSDEHPWFMESRTSRDNPKRDWYIWRDGKPNNQPPNNWKSNFGGSAWTLDEKTNQYYYHAFDPKQPDLNWRNPEVVKAMMDVLRFWLDLGVDGFRVDAVYFLFEDPKFKDEPINPNFSQGIHSEHDSLLHTHTFALPETIQMIKAITNVLKEYNNTFMVNEVYAELPKIVEMYKTVDWQYFTSFNFTFITNPWKAEVQQAEINLYDEAMGEQFLPVYVLGNHDQHRVATRLGPDQARVAAIALFTVRGLPFVYYGDEIGMTDTEIKPDQVVDPYELKSPGLGLGRDPERSPMQWSDSQNAGFSESTSTWLPITANYKTLNVKAEESDPKSFLALYKLLIKLKKHHPALRDGSYQPLPTPAPNVFTFIREEGTDKVLVLLNFDNEDKQIKLDFKDTKLLACATMGIPEGEKLDLTGYFIRGNEALVLSL